MRRGVRRRKRKRIRGRVISSRCIRRVMRRWRGRKRR